MLSLKPSLWRLLGVLALLILGSLILASCTTKAETGTVAISTPAALPVNTIGVAIATASDLPSSSPTASIGVYPADLRTGLADLDPVLVALASGDAAQIAAVMSLLQTACTTAEGLGGPPKCGEDQPEGTVVSGFPVQDSEGYFATAEGLPQLAEGLASTGVFGIYRVTSGPGPEEAYWPSGRYGIVLAADDPTRATTLLVDGGRIVRLNVTYGGGPAQAFDNGRGEIVVAPLQ